MRGYDILWEQGLGWKKSAVGNDLEGHFETSATSFSAALLWNHDVNGFATSCSCYEIQPLHRLKPQGQAGKDQTLLDQAPKPTVSHLKLLHCSMFDTQREQAHLPWIVGAVKWRHSLLFPISGRALPLARPFCPHLVCDAATPEYHTYSMFPLSVQFSVYFSMSLQVPYCLLAPAYPRYLPMCCIHGRPRNDVLPCWGRKGNRSSQRNCFECLTIWEDCICA